MLRVRSLPKLYIPLFWKFAIAVIGVVTLFGSINVFMVYRNVYEPLDHELEQRGLFISKSLAHQAAPYLLYEDVISLQKLVDASQSIDSTIAYIIVFDNTGRIQAHTFLEEVPYELIHAHPPGTSRNTTIVSLAPKQQADQIIKDICEPILENRVGAVRIGLRAHNINRTVRTTVVLFVLMISGFLVVGLAGAFLFAHVITTPIKQIADTAMRLELGIPDSDNRQLKKSSGLLSLISEKRIIHIEDELDVLQQKFDGMIDRLNKAYIALRSAQMNLMQSEKMASVGTLAAGIAHEINNPIAGIQNCLRRISKDPVNVDQNIKYLDMMHDATGKIEVVVKRLLNFSRKNDQEFTSVQLTDIVESALLLVGYKLEKYRIAFEKNYPHKIPPILGNANQIEQVIVNLILNAIDAIEERAKSVSGHKKITFVIRVTGSALELDIEDSGTGITEEHKSKIFDPFYTTKEVGSGTGLGLAVSYSIVKDHRGDIRVTGNTFGGATFTITFPLYVTETTQE